MAQFLRPDSNLTQTSYTGGFAEIDEVTASDTDLAFGGVNSATPTLVVHLSNPAATPQSGTCTVRWRSARRNAAGTINSGNAFTGTCTLLQGTTTIASDAYTPGAYSTRSFTFTHGSITDWTDLRLRFTQTASGGTGNNRSGLAVSWAEVEIPDGLAAYSLVADKGTFTETGIAAGILHTARLVADSGLYTQVGKDASLVKKRTLVAEKGTFTHAGQSASIRHTVVLVADKGAFTFSGVAAGVLYGRIFTASAGSIILTGLNADLHSVQGIDINGDPGPFVVTGTDAQIRKGFVLIAATRAFNVTVNTASLIYSGAASADKPFYYQTIETDPRKMIISTGSGDQLVYYVNPYLRIL